MQSMLDYQQNGRCSFIFTTLLVLTTTLAISAKNPFLYFSQFLPPYSTHLSLITLPSSIPKQLFASLFFLTTIPTIYTKIIFFTSAIQSIQAASVDQELGSLLRTNTFLISRFFLKAWKVITGITITDYLLLRLRKLVYYRQQSLMEMLVIGMANYPIHLLSYPNLLSLLPYPSNFITRARVPLETTCLTLFSS